MREATRTRPAAGARPAPLGALLAALLVLAACNSSEPSSEEATSAGTVTSSASGATAGGDGSGDGSGTGSSVAAGGSGSGAGGGSTTSGGARSSSTAKPAVSSSSGVTSSAAAGGAGAGGTSGSGASGASGASGTVAKTECAVIGPLPAVAAQQNVVQADVDADGAIDTVVSYALGPNPVAGDWHLRVTFASGGGSDIALAENPAPGTVRVLGTAYIGSTVDPGVGGMRPTIFVWTGAGASARTVGLYRVDGCELATMTAPGGQPASMVVGASVGHQEGVRCEGVAGTSLVVEVLSEPNPVAGFDVTRRAFSRDGNSLVLHGSAQVLTQPDPPAEAGQIVDCGDVPSP